MIVKNPLLDWIKWLIFPIENSFIVMDKIYDNYDSLESDYGNNLIHPGDLKKAMIDVINKLLNPVRAYFETNKVAMDLLEQVRKYR